MTVAPAPGGDEVDASAVCLDSVVTERSPFRPACAGLRCPTGWSPPAGARRGPPPRRSRRSPRTRRGRRGRVRSAGRRRPHGPGVRGRRRACRSSSAATSCRATPRSTPDLGADRHGGGRRRRAAFGSVLAMGLPLLAALLGLGIGLTRITLVSAFVDLNSTAPTLATMIGMAVGIDDALFIVTGHRQGLGERLTVEEAAARANATAGSAVVFAGGTVVIAISGLAVVDIPFLTTIGLATAGVVGIAVLVAVSLIPALLGFAGTNIDRWTAPFTTTRTSEVDRQTFGARWARKVTRRPAVSHDEVFITSRIREDHSRTGKPKESVISGLTSVGKGDHRGGADHDLGVRGVRPRRRSHDRDVRQAGGGRVPGRHRGADDHRARGDVAARPGRLVAAEMARSHRPERRHRGTRRRRSAGSWWRGDPTRRTRRRAGAALV